MAVRPRSFVNRIIRQRARRTWHSLAGSVGKLGRAKTKKLRNEAQMLSRDLNLFLARTDPRGEQARQALDALHLPVGTDWRWRPDIMTGQINPKAIVSPQNGEKLGAQAALWHDCDQSTVILEQVVNNRSTDLAPFGLRMEVFGFSGSYLAMSIDLPQDALDGLTRDYILRLETILAVERKMRIFARLNVVNGPNNDQVTHDLGEIVSETGDQYINEFDLAYTEINEKRLEKIWLDLIFEAPHMNALLVRDIFFSRHRRAEF